MKQKTPRSSEKKQQWQHCWKMVTCLPTTWQESELMFRNNGLLHHNLIIAVGLQATFKVAVLLLPNLANLTVFPRIWACFLWSCGFF